MKKTVLVVGAGASHDFGLPLGANLAEKIRQSLAMDFSGRGGNHGPIAIALMHEGMSTHDVVAGRELRDVLLNSQSIDHALYTRRDNSRIVRVGKAAIAHHILAGERACHLPKGPNPSGNDIHDGMNPYRQSWLGHFFRHLASSRTPNEYEDIFDDIAFITFNYDRCIEQYLYYALRTIGSQTPEIASKLVEKCPIQHVYGDLGRPRFLGGNGSAEFGADENAAAWMYKNLRTFTEGAEDGVLKSVSDIIAGSERVVFLGFGFDVLNVQVLFPQRHQGQEFRGTRLGLSRRRVAEVSDYLFGDPSIGLPALSELNCSDFMAQFGEELFS